VKGSYRGSNFTRSYHVVFQRHWRHDPARRTVVGVDGERIRRKPVLEDLVDEYEAAAQRTEDPQVAEQILVSCRTGYLANV
jgi:hypothetical protein